MPARAAMPRPSPVLMKALVEEWKIRPAPPVAKMVALAWKTTTSPVSEHLAFGVANQVERHPLDEELRIGLDVALVHRMQHRVAGAVGGGAGTTYRFLAEIRHVAAERTLIDLAGVGAIEGHAVVFELDDAFVSLAAHELDGILVAEPVGPLDGVIHMPVPVIFLGITQRSGDAALRGDCVRAGREHLGQDRGLETGFRQLNRGSQPGAAGADDDRVESTNGSAHDQSLQIICAAQPA
jgi:hypothetical protein